MSYSAKMMARSVSDLIHISPLTACGYYGTL